MGLLLGTLLLLAVAAPEARAAAAPLYVALGDSTAVGYGAREGGYVTRLHTRLRLEWGDVRVENFAQNGATSATVLARQIPGLQKLRPALVTLGVGVNDVARQVAPAVFRRNLEQIVAAVQATGAQLVLATLPDASLAPVVPSFLRKEVRARVTRLNEEIAALAKKMRLTVVDLFTPSQQHLPSHPEYFCSDGFHPSDLGQAFWADTMWPVVRATFARQVTR